MNDDDLSPDPKIDADLAPSSIEDLIKEYPRDDEGRATEQDYNAASEFVQRILDTLVPPEGAVIIYDIVGCEHSLRTAVPAAIEVRLVRMAQEVLGQRAPDIEEAQNLGGVIAIIERISDPDTLKLIGRMFRTAHPRAFRDAAVHTYADKDLIAMLVEVGDLPEKAEVSDLRPEHCFDLSTMVEALVPFVARTAAKIKPMATRFLMGSR